MQRLPLARSLTLLGALAALSACQVGEGKADSLAIAQITPTSAPTLVIPLKESQAALRGLERIDLHASFEEFAGVDTAAIRGHVESRLRTAGLTLDSTSTAAVLLRCFALPGRTGIVAYTCSVDLSDVVAYGIPAQGHYQAILWGGAPILGMAGREHLVQGVTDVVDDEVGRFIDAWSKANPR